MIELLQKIVESTPGAKAAILMGFDGISVAQFVAPQDDELDVESMATELSFRFMELRTAAASLEMGSLSDIAIQAEYGTVLVRVLSEEYFVAVLLERTGHFGKGRWVLRSTARALAAQL
ncbi:MAG: hypothetical protein B7733_21130 [Myxococcales bacterium FL481]|nr:MAG: hypothetical protein B7733_21130 [Myxococcales bacterium FL481]